MKVLIPMIVLLLLSAFYATVPVSLKISNQEVLLGQGSGALGGEAELNVQNVDGTTCKGSFHVPVSGGSTEGLIKCSDGREGKFIAIGKGTSWAGEGKLDDGTRFSLIIGRQGRSIVY